MRFPRRWLMIGALCFGCYLLLLGLFVLRQATLQSRGVKWSKAFGKGGVAELLLLDNGNLLVEGNDGRLSVLSPEGRLAWQQDGNGPWGPYHNSYRCLPGGGLLLITESQPQQLQMGGAANITVTGSGHPEILRLDADGRELARINPGFVFDTNIGLLPTDGPLILEDANDELRCIDDQAQLLWHSGNPGGSYQLSGPGGGLLLLDSNAINGEADLALLDGSGVQLWQQALPGDFGSPLLVAGDAILYIDAGGSLRCLGADGNERWRHDPPNPLPVQDIGTLQYRGAWVDINTYIELLPEQRVLVSDGEGLVQILGLDGMLLNSINLPLSADIRLSVDLARGRIVAVGEGGMEVYDLQGQLIGRNGFLRCRGVPLLDRSRGVAYLDFDGMLYCVEY
ncbi:MAG: PQQ-binding-like beta-propeller repeat protein [bacterium]